MNLGQFRTAIDRRTGVATDTSAQTEWINFVLNELALEERWPWLEKTTTVSLVAGTKSYALPTDVRTVVSVHDDQEHDYDTGSIRDLALFNRSDDVPSQFGFGYFYATDGLNIFVAPAPSASGTLTVRYIANETALSGDSDSPLLPSSYHQAVVELAAFLVQNRRMAGTDDQRRADAYQKAYGRIVHKMKREALRRVGPARVARIRPGAGW